MMEKHYTHHGAVAFEAAGEVLFDAVRLLGVGDVATPLPPALPYPGENPFA